MRKESPHSRRALVQLRFLFGAAVLCVGGAAWVASAQTSSLSPVKMTIASAGKNRSKPVTLSDLPGMVETYGAARQQTTSASTSASLMATRNVSTGASGYNLVETDLTPNSPSDEREPAYSPGGDFIIFRSNGADADGDGTIDSINAENKTHIWLMNRDGSDQRQITGLGVDKTRNQSRPSWSPDGNQVVYVDDDPDDATSTQLWVVQPFSDQDGDPTDGLQLEPAEQRTFFKGKKEAPAWAPSGLAIAFATNYDALPADTNAPLGQKDIFSISPDGSLNSLTRLTGGTVDPVGNSTDDTNPAYALVNQNVMFFSSNRDKNGVLTGAAVKGRRIWKMFIDGSSKVPFTDPTVRTDAKGNTVGRPDDQDDFPAPSPTKPFSSPQGPKTVAESISFQTNTYLDASDAAKVAGRDLNIWTLPYDTTRDKFSPTTEEPLIYLSSFNSSRVLTFDTETGLASDAVPPITLTGGNPEGIGLDDTYMYVSDRGGSAVDRYLEADGTAQPGNGQAGANFTTPLLVPQPSGLLVDDNFIYVASGNSGTATPNTTALYRFSIDSGNPAPRTGAAAGTAVFSSLDSTANGGASDAGKIVDGAEGLSFYSTAFPNSFAQNFIFVSVYSDDKVNVYNKTTGDFVTVFVPNSPAADTTRLDGPTGLAWGPDINQDGFPDLYVNSSAGNAVKVYAGFNPTDTTMAVKVGVNADVTPGTLIGDLIPPARATATDLHAPEGLGVLDRDRDGTYEVYVSDFQSTGTGGTHVNRYKFNPATAYNTTTGVLQSATPFPLTTTANPNNAVYLQGDARNPANYQINGPGYFAFNTTALNTSGTTAPATLTPVETAKAAIIISNILSSPQNFADSRLKSPNTVDQAADREPTYSRVTGTAQLLARLALASTRVYEPNTSSNGSTTKTNPYGGDQLLADGSVNPAPTHDIWSVSTQDTTPPALVPQGAGNLQYPVVAPQPNAPFKAPRTAEEGLKAGAKAAADGLSGDASALHLAVVLRDLESGLNETYGSKAVTAQFFRASNNQFQTQKDNIVNVSTKTDISIEQKAQLVSIGGLTTFELHVYDDGPVNSGGHEQQADAVAGDGVYYCEAILPTPAVADDYYIDISATDRKLNTLNYDNIWGFSTKLFQKQANTKTDLFVSDYTCGQDFPEIVAATSNLDDGRFSNMIPVESYWLTNPPGTAHNDKGSASSVATTFPNVDVWRVLCRGPVPQTVLDSYRPTITKQLDPNDPTGKFVDKTRDVAVSDTAVVWAAPYAGTSFVGPGTIIDPTTQSRLTNFLSNGGRLFISGRDIAWALSSAGALPNDFLNKELASNFASETYVGGTIIASSSSFSGGLQIPHHVQTTVTDTYDDAAFDMNGGTIACEADVLTPQTVAGATVSTAYTAGGVVGQSIVTTRTSGIESRVVFLSFGFEAINRQYALDANGAPVALNVRFNMANSIRQYFKTGGISGSVINNATNLPIPNFLLKVTGPSGTYLVRTDTNGNYQLTGLPPAVNAYTVQPYLRNGLTDPEGFFGGTPRTGITVSGGSITQGVNLRPIPTQPGAIIGRATASNNTPASKKLPNGASGRSDDIPLANTPVLVYSVNSSSVFPNGGQFARLASTDAGGNFSIANVPAGAKMVVVFNPNQSDIPKGSNLTAPARNSKYGRRVVPDSKRPDDIIVPSGDNFILNDVIPTTEDPASTAAQQVDDQTDNGVPVVVPSGPSINVAATFNDAIVDPAVTPISVTLFSVAADGTQTVVGTQVASATTGAVTFEDLPPGKYLLTGTITLADGTVITRNSSTLTLVQGSDLPVNLQLYAINIVGKVLKNGQPLTSSATVTLYNTDGTAVTPARSVTTAADGTYRITLVAPGRYVVKANQGGVEGSATVVVGHAPVAGNGSNGYDTPAPDINLNQRILSGVVNFIYGGDNVRTATPLAGAQVDLYVQNGTKPYKTVTSGNDGSFGFVNVPAGNYYIVATYPPSAIISDTVQSPVFAVSTNSTTPAQKLTIILHKITVKTVDSSGNALSGVTVGLFLKGGTTAVATGTTAGGQFLFDQVVASPTGTSYEIHASTGNLSGSLVVPTFRRNAKPFTVTVTLTAGATNVDNPTVFAVGKTYLISLPYETSANRRTSNVSPDHMVGSGIEQDVATIKVSEAFNVPPVVGNTTYYNLSAYNPTTLNYEKLTADSLLKRGVGYVLQVLTRPAGDDVKLNLPGNPASFRGQVLDDRTRQKEFTIKLTYPVSLNGNAAAGRNLIGFGFDPSKYSIVPWDANDDTKTYVEVLNGANSYSLKQAVKLKLINGALQTIDPATGKTVNASGITKFGGCWVQSYVNGLQLVLHTK